MAKLTDPQLQALSTWLAMYIRDKAPLLSQTKPKTFKITIEEQAKGFVVRVRIKPAFADQMPTIRQYLQDLYKDFLSLQKVEKQSTAPQFAKSGVSVLLSSVSLLAIHIELGEIKEEKKKKEEKIAKKLPQDFDKNHSSHTTSSTLSSNASKMSTPVVVVKKTFNPVIENLKFSVNAALELQKTRLEEKLNGFFSWATINTKLVRKKIETLEVMMSQVEKAIEPIDIYKMMYQLNQDMGFIPNDQASKLIVVENYDAILNKHRIGFFGNTSTHDELVSAFNKLKPSA